MNLMAAYERYLALTFFLSLLIRVRDYRDNLRFAWRFPKEWPGILDIVKQHSRLFFNWTTLFPVAVTFVMFVAHSVCYRLVWTEASITPSTLSAHWPLLIMLLPISLALLILDFKALFWGQPTDFEEVEATLNQGEAALRSKALASVKYLTFGLIRPRKYIEQRVQNSLKDARLALIGQLRRWTFHTVLRLTAGFLLWIGFVRASHGLSAPAAITLQIYFSFLLLISFYWGYGSILLTPEDKTMSTAIKEEITPSAEDDTHELTDILGQVAEETQSDGEEKITLDQLLEPLKHRSFGPFLLLPAAIAVSPLGGIPGMSILTGLLIILVAIQVLWGKTRPWLPNRLLQFEVPRDKVSQSIERWRPRVRKFERLIHERWTLLARPPAIYALAAICILLAGLFFPAALIPYAVAVPGLAVMFISLGITARDGLLILCGLATSVAAAWIVWAYWPL